jgi:5''-nucleotidase/2'',3''-cyclic phosphodiesterase and related esterases
MRMLRRRAAVLGVVCGLLAAGPARAAGRVRITVLHTSDTHGHVLPFDDTRNRPAAGSLAQVAILVARIRSSVRHPVLLLDSGDTIQGTPFEQFVHVRWKEPSRPSPP